MTSVRQSQYTDHMTSVRQSPYTDHMTSLHQPQHRTQISERDYGKAILSGWMSPRETYDLATVHDDVALLKECAAASKRRCSSAAIQRQKFSHSVYVQLERLGRISVSKSETNISVKKDIKENGSCTQSKDSGLSELVSTSSMERFRLEDEEFSDLSDSDDSSIKEELQISWSSKTSLLDDTEAVEGARTELKQYLDKLTKFKDLSVEDSKESEYKKGIQCCTGNLTQRPPNDTQRPPNNTQRSPNTKQRSLTPDNRQSASYHREHTIPHSFTTELPAPPLLRQGTLPQPHRSLPCGSWSPHRPIIREQRSVSSQSAATPRRDGYPAPPLLRQGTLPQPLRSLSCGSWSPHRPIIREQRPVSSQSAATPRRDGYPDRPTQTQLWSKRQKERLQNNKGTTSPLLTNSLQQAARIDNKVNRQSKHFPGNLLQLNNTTQNNVKINIDTVMGSLYSRPPYRNEKRRGSTISKSSASIPSLSTPCQALLLVGVQPAKPIGTTKQLKRAHRASGAFKPSIPATQPTPRYVQDDQNLVELPALMVNGAGDLVIRKKQIMPT